jgi:PKD repeat protein
VEKLKTRRILLILLAQLVSACLAGVQPTFSQSAVPTLKVEPESYTASMLCINETFTINITISDVDINSKLALVQFRLQYNESLLEVVDVAEGSFLQNPSWAPYGSFFINYTEEDDPVYGTHVLVGDMLLPNGTGSWNVFPSGNGTVTTITFKEIYQPIEPESSASCTFKLVDTLLLDPGANAISHNIEDGLYTIESLPLPVLTAEPNTYTASKRGELFNINITIGNLDVRWRDIFVHFRLGYDAHLLEVVDVAEGSFLQNPSWAPYGSFFINYTEEDDPVYGTHVLVGDMLLPNGTGSWNVFPSGNGTVTTITFKAISQTTVDPEPPANCTLEFIETTLYDDKAQELPHKSSSGFYQIESLKYPIASFTHEPQKPSTGEVVLFDASRSYDPDYQIQNYTWNFGDGNIELTTSPTTGHVYAKIGTYQVTLTVADIDGLTNMTSSTIEVGTYAPLQVSIDAGSIYFKGETAEFNLLITDFGEPVNATKLEAKLCFNGTFLQDLSNSIECVATGLYRIPYTVPISAEAGVYTLLAKAEYYEAKGASIKSFQISPTLTNWNDSIAKIVEIEGETATIQTDIDSIKVNLTSINARLTGIEGNTAIIDSKIGTLQTDLTNINATLTGIIINSKGEVLAKIDSTLGSITTKLGETQSTVTTTLYVASILSAIILILALAILMFVRKK